MRIQIYKTTISLLMVGLILSPLPKLAFGGPSFVFAQKLPENFEDLKGIGKGLWDRFIQGLKGAWEEAVKIWKKVIGWIGNIWNSYIFPFLKFIWQKIWNFCLQVLKTIWEKIVKTVWEKIKGFIKQ